MIEIEDIEKISANRGGLATVQIIFEKDIVSAPVYDAFSLLLSGDLVLQPGAKIYDIYFTRQSAKFQEKTLTNQSAGDYCTQSLTFKTPRDRPEVKLLIERLKNNRVAVMYKDWNGQYKFIRNLRCNATVDTGTLGQYNGTSFAFKGQSKRCAGFLEQQLFATQTGIGFWGIENGFVVS